MFTAVEDIKGDDEEDTQLLKQMAAKARAFVSGFKWCPPIRAAYFATGVGKIIALFLFEFDGKIGGTDDRLWVVVGDIPSMYMIVEPGDTPKDILESYCAHMDAWAEAVLVTHDFEGIYPVDAPKTAANAEDLRSRIDFIGREILPTASEDPVGE